MTGHFVHPFDDDQFIAGNGTLALEIFEDLPDVGAIVAPLGGGGLLSGIAAVSRELARDADIRRRTRNSVTAGGVARGWTGGDLRPLEIVLRRRSRRQIRARFDVAAPPDRFRVHRRHAGPGRGALRFTAERAHVIAEGAAGCAVAAALGGGAGATKVVAVVSGGNIDLAKFASLVGACDNRAG